MAPVGSYGKIMFGDMEVVRIIILGLASLKRGQKLCASNIDVIYNVHELINHHTWVKKLCFYVFCSFYVSRGNHFPYLSFIIQNTARDSINKFCGFTGT